MAKKNPNDIIFQAALKDAEKMLKTMKKTFKKNEVALRVAEECHDLRVKGIKLEHFLWETETNQDGETISRYTEAAKALPYNHRRLLISQHKVMKQYIEILGKRLDLFEAAK